MKQAAQPPVATQSLVAVYFWDAQASVSPAVVLRVGGRKQIGDLLYELLTNISKKEPPCVFAAHLAHMSIEAGLETEIRSVPVTTSDRVGAIQARIHSPAQIFGGRGSFLVNPYANDLQIYGGCGFRDGEEYNPGQIRTYLLQEEVDLATAP